MAALATAIQSEGPAVELSADGGLTLHQQSELASSLLPDSDGGVAAVVATSGSTGTPKRTLLGVDALAASSMGTAMALRGEGQWLLALPTHYVAGLQVLVRSLFAGTQPWLMDLSGGFTPSAFTAAAEELTDRIRFTSLVPTQLSRLLADPQPATLAVLRRFNSILLGGAPATAALLKSAADAGLKVVTTYGMSETCGGCVYNGVPLEGVQVRVDDGRISLGGDVLASGYLANPELSAKAFHTEQGTRWYRTEDLGELDTTNRLKVRGRADDVVMTGGLKVSAAHVTAALEGLDGVTAAFATGIPDTQWGQRVAAMVVTTLPKDQITAGCAAVLEPHAVPKTIAVVSELPLLPNGKPDRQRICALLSQAANAADSAQNA